MATATVEPGKPPKSVINELPNPVIKDDFGAAKLAFKEARVAEGLDEPTPEPKVTDDKPEPVKITTDTVRTPETSPSKEGEPPSKPTDAPQTPKVLPDDVLEPKPSEEPKKSSAISEIEAMELPKTAKEKQVADFNKIKTKAISELTAAEAKISDLEKRVGQATTNKEVETLREKLKGAEEKAAQIEDEWAKRALETSPRFQQQFVKKEQQAIDAAKGFLEGTEIDPRVIDYAARVSGSVRLKVLEEAGLEAKQIGAVEARLAQYDSIQRDKTEAIEHWREQGAQWQDAEAKRAEAEQAKRTEFENKTWEKVLSKNANLLPFRSSKDETWNSNAEAFKSQARDVFLGKGADPETMADIVQRGVVARSGFYDKIIEHLTKENKLQAQQIAKLTSAAPGGGITSTAGTPTATDKSKMTREELSKSTFNEQLAAAKGA